jgi:hypothetical protein
VVRIGWSVSRADGHATIRPSVVRSFVFVRSRVVSRVNRSVVQRARDVISTDGRTSPRSLLLASAAAAATAVIEGRAVIDFRKLIIGSVSTRRSYSRRRRRRRTGGRLAESLSPSRQRPPVARTDTASTRRRSTEKRARDGHYKREIIVCGIRRHRPTDHTHTARRATHRATKSRPRPHVNGGLSAGAILRRV